MTREEIEQILKRVESRSIVLELGTGYGKTKMALDKAVTIGKEILVVVPTRALITNWQEEIKKWYPGYISNIKLTTLRSVYKFKGVYDVVIFDEAHRITQEPASVYISNINAKLTLYLSATIPKERLRLIRVMSMDKPYIISSTVKEAVESKVLPKPKVIYKKLRLMDVPGEFMFNKYQFEATKYELERMKFVTIKYEDLPNYKQPTPCVVRCTAYQYYGLMMKSIDRLKKLSETSSFAMNMWKKACRERLVWLSSLKTRYVNQLNKEFAPQGKIMYFCSSQEQALEITPHALVSNNKNRKKDKEDFDNGTIQVSSSVNMMSEGINFNNCKTVIHLHIPSSKILQVQRLGRSLRCENPNVVYVFFGDTREEQIIKKNG